MERIKLNIQRFAENDNSVEVELVMVIQELQKAITNANKSLGTLKGKVVETKKETQSLGTVIKGAISGLNVSAITTQIKKLGKSLYNDFITKAIDTSEELNLFNVVFDNIQENGKTTFSKLGKEATQFQNKMNEAFGTNMKETMRYQGLFQAMGESAGLNDDIAELMSENMAKLSYDLASLYNTTETKAAESLRAGVYAGQTKPLRNYGIDVTQTSYKPLMEELGLEKSVSELTQAEKEVLRYISTLRQAENAMGDFANTIESPANQLKVLRQQFYEMQAAIGNLFVGAFARILPYVNGIIMAIKAVAKAIASFLGIKMQDYNSHVAGYGEALDDYSDSLDGVASSAGGASDAIKELKRQTLGFDQINNLTSPTPKSGSGGSGGGGGVAGGIDQRLLDAIHSYDNGMENVRMKATDIRDKIMQILGFTKKTNEETGETYFVYGGWQETVKGILGWFKELNPLAKIFAGLGISSAFVTLFKILKKISDLTGVTTVLTGIFNISKKLISPLGNLGKAIGKLVSPKGAESVGKVAGITDTMKKSFSVPSVKTILTGIADVALVVGGTVALISAIGLLTKIPGFNDVVSSGIGAVKKVFLGIGEIIIPLGIVSAGMALMGSMGVANMALGLADLAIVILGTEVIMLAVGAISKLSGDFISTGIDTMKKVINGIMDVIIPIGILSGALALVGLAGGYGAAAIAMGLADLALVIAGTEVVIAAIGALNQIEGFSWLVGEGISVLKKLFEGLGEIAGSLVKGFLNVSFSGLEDIGTHLAGFMYNAQPFFDGVSNINEGVTRGMKNLAATVLILTANEILDGLTSWFTGGTDMKKFGQDLAGFAPYFKEYADIIKDINPDVVVGSATAAKSLAEFAKNIPNEGGVAAWFAGENKLDVFSSYLPTFGKNMKKYADAVAGIDTNVVVNSANAAKSIVEMSKQVPNEGGVAAWFAGDNKLDKFSKYLPTFGANMKKYADNVAGLDTSVVENSAKAAKSLAEMSKQIPNEGGIAAWFAGENTIDKFSSYLPNFGKNMKTYAKNIAGIDPSVIENSADAAKAIAKMSKELPNEGGVASWFAGDNTLDRFGEVLAEFGKYFKQYYNSIKEVAISKVDAVTNSIKEIVTQLKKVKDNGLSKTITEFASSLSSSSKNISSFFQSTFTSGQGWSMGYNFGASIGTGIKNGIRDYLTVSVTVRDAFSNIFQTFRIRANAMGGIFANGMWQPIQAYANGGVPSGGQMFIAREAGPELVGKIGRHTAVMNNNQIVDSVKAGVYEAVSAAMSEGGMGSVQIDLHTDEGVVVDRINRITRQTGNCPIEI